MPSRNSAHFFGRVISTWTRSMIRSINHITLAVIDINRSFEFYRDILLFTPLCRWDKGAYFLISDLWFCLNVDEKRVPSTCYTHYAFTVSAHDFESTCQRLHAAGVIVFKENTSPGDSLYFLDPDGHKLEIHVGNWQTRIIAKKQNLGSWQNVEWFV